MTEIASRNWGLLALASALLHLSLYPHRTVLPRRWRDVSARRDLRVGVEYRRRLCRPGIGRPQHVLRHRRLCARCCFISCGAGRRSPAFRSASSSALLLAVAIGLPTFRLHRALFQHGDDRDRRADPHFRRHLGPRRRGDRLAGTGGGTRMVGSDLSQRAALLLHLSRRAGGAALHHLRDRSAAASAIICAPSRTGERAARSLGVPVRQTKLKALMLSATFTSSCRLALHHQDRLHRSGKRVSAFWSRCRW